ncbi:YceH family protein [Pseudoxanthomonas dokdonensis]|uniref:Sigma-54 factor interaction domain-containing protein n=1 Tax=Pseudoxanthomonas dokdonensis TaxID=344882 RepID=A0A0R0CGT0_9GAMM|nr:DUF480 domain-containing protein [Pseudoxanthomonas dokdonensis]KRG68294.1 hypothetical protein ABB29_13275 [Pseudoxanthomonas dokdonensis]
MTETNESSAPDSAPPALPELSPLLARLLGCLIEKEATTPDSYPLTVNAAVSAANQKTARDPLMSLQPGAVNHGLRELEALGLARQVFSSRAERYEHLAGKAFNLPRQQVALLGLLLLRGPQTLHELLARSERLYAFSDAEEVQHQLQRMAQREPSLLVQLPRGPGQREDRYMHLLSGDIDLPALNERIAATAAAPAFSLQSRLEALEAEVQVLKQQLAELLEAKS